MNFSFGEKFLNFITVMNEWNNNYVFTCPLTHSFFSNSFLSYHQTKTLLISQSTLSLKNFEKYINIAWLSGTQNL